MTFDKRFSLPPLLHEWPFGLRLLLLAAVPMVFSLILYPRIMVPRLQYAIGDVAEKDVKAPRELLVKDQAATEIKRQQAVQEVLTVYDQDNELSARLARMVESL